MSDIFQEVDEEVRRDRAVEFWTKYQNAILAGALLIVLATAGYRFWQYRATAAAESAGAQFQTALRLDAENKPDEAKAALAALQQQGAAGYAPLSRFVDAGLALKKDPKAGAAAFQALADDSSLDPLLRDTAKLRAGLALIDAGETDAGRAALEPLADSSPYRETARLTLASVALAAKNYDAAAKRLHGVIADPAAPTSDRRTAQTLLGLVASQAPAALKTP